ncbi:MAG: PPK2 family polyphosphate kinase [Myxococcota bacterium]
MDTRIDSPLQVPFDGSFRLDTRSTVPASPLRDKVAKAQLKDTVKAFAEHQRALYAEDRRSLLLIFQAIDAAGKDSTIRAVTRGVNPAGFQIHSFKAPNAEELDHDFLWRTAKRLPERGRIGIFNRSYYEEVLVVRVHPEYLAGQRIDVPDPIDDLWTRRFEAIRAHERHLADNGTVIMKFFLHVSRDEQARRFLSRLQNPHKNWKFSASDLKERAHWDSYQHAFSEALAATSTPWAPWYVIPADNKPNMRLSVATLIEAQLRTMNLTYPALDAENRARLPEFEAQLKRELGLDGT